MLGVAVRLDLDAAAGTIVGSRLAVGAASPTPIRSEAAEGLLAGAVAGLDGRLEAAAAALADAAELIDDGDGSAEYKRHLISVHLARLVRGLLRGEDLPLAGTRERRSLAATVGAWNESRRHVPKPASRS